MGKITAIVLSSCIFWSFASAQVPCDSLFRNVIVKTKNNRERANAEGFYMKCHIVMTDKNEVSRPIDMEVKTYKDKYYYKSGSMQFYHDNSTVVAVNTEAKSLFITTPQLENKRRDQFEELLQLQDSLLGKYQIVGCKKEWGTVVSGVALLKFHFVPKGKNSYKMMRSLTYWVEESTWIVRKIQIDYFPSKDNPIRSYQMTIGNIMVGKVVAFEGTALSKAYNGNKLIDMYRNYSVVDKRKVRSK